MSLTYFERNNAGSEELWVSDGTVAGTRLVKAFGSAGIAMLTVIGARAYFSFDDGIHGKELWTSDGTAAGTMLVDDIQPGGSSSPVRLTNVDGTLFFEANDGVHGLELWKSDGTAADTVMVKDINPGAVGSAPSLLTNVNGTLFFDANDGTDGFELWKSDGTRAGTTMVKDIEPGAGSSDPHELVNVNGVLFFQATDSVSGDELWRSDGTAAGTVLVKDIFPGAAASSFPSTLTNVNGTLFFSAETSGPGDRELWKSDGTAAGTVLVKDIDPGSSGSDPQFLTNVNGTLFFEATDGVHGSELWKSDGTTAGTMMVADINPGGLNSFPQGLTNVNGTLFFAADDGVHGSELWRSDGTAAGTVLVKDINSGMDGSSPIFLTNVNGVLEFYAFDGLSEGLFRSDGTAAGTVELAANVDTSNPIGFSPSPLPSDFNDDRITDVLWRNSNGTLADWSLNGGVISAGGFPTSGGVMARPDAGWSISGISDFNGDGRADVLWRNTDGTLADWTMSGSTIASSGVLNLAGVAVKPDASWSVAGVGDFDGDGRSDILWRNSNGTLAEWRMNGPTIMSSGFLTSGGAAVKPDASWSVAGVGDFDGDGRSDILWRNASGEVTEWRMNGTTIAGSGDITFGGVAARPDATWSIAGLGDFNHDGKADLLWRSANDSLAMWLMNGTAIGSSGSVTSNGAPVAPDASWHVVEIGDFNGDSNADILWRNNDGALAEWLMNGNAIGQSLTPTSNGAMVSPEASWSTQAKPTISA